MLHDILVATCLVMVIEGILPFISPHKWKEMMSIVVKKSDKSLRTIGLISMSIGAIVLYLIR